MKHRLSFFILCALTWIAVSAAVHANVSGTVVDAETDEPVQGVVVQVISDTGKAVGFTSSKADGSFSLRVGENAASLSFRCLGYETRRLPLDSVLSRVELTPKATALRDVIVKAPDIYAKGDTLVFNVEKYATDKDNAIIDIIKRLPGIKVEDDGTIKYQGKPISKFYLDGNDFLDGQYGLATENISHKDVKSVEVMENHQPIKALEGIEFPEEAGINLTLKEDARSRWVGVTEAGIGATPLLGRGAVFAMRMARKVQNLMTVKADNTGWNPRTEIVEHGYEDMFGSMYDANPWLDYITADAVNTPLAENRTRDNRSGLADVITAWRRGDTSMRLKLDYVGDRLEYSSGSVTDYFSPSVPEFVQRNSLLTNTHSLSAQLNAEVNRKDCYLKNKLTVGADWDDSDSRITGSLDVVQQIGRRRLAATDDLKIVRRTEKRLFHLASRLSVVHDPASLSVGGTETAWQQLGIDDIRSTTELQVGRMGRFWKFYASVGADFNYRRTKASLAGLGDMDADGLFNAFVAKIYAAPKAEYERKGWRLSLAVPVEWTHMRLCGHRDYAGTAPCFQLRRLLSARSELSVTLSMALSPPSPHLFIDMPVMRDFRNVLVGPGQCGTSLSGSAAIAWRWRDPLRALFINASASASASRSPIMGDQVFAGDIVVTAFAPVEATGRSWNATAGVSKGFGHGSMVAGADIALDGSSGRAMREGSPMPFSRLILEARPYFRGSLARWLSIDYSLVARMSSLMLEGRHTTLGLAHTLTATVTLHDRVDVTAGAEHRLTRLPGAAPSSIVLLDASAAWRVNGRVRLALNARNLLDSRSYSYVVYGTLSQQACEFALRPATVVVSAQYRF